MNTDMKDTYTMSHCRLFSAHFVLAVTLAAGVLFSSFAPSVVLADDFGPRFSNHALGGLDSDAGSMDMFAGGAFDPAMLNDIAPAAGDEGNYMSEEADMPPRSIRIISVKPTKFGRGSTRVMRSNEQSPERLKRVLPY